MQRGEIWWADLPTPVASEPGYRRPILILLSVKVAKPHPTTMRSLQLPRKTRRQRNYELAVMNALN